MNHSPVTTETYEKFKALRDAAIQELLALHEGLKATFEEGIEAMRVKFESDSSEVARKLAELGHQLPKEEKTSVAATKRRRFAKVSDDELKSKLTELLSGGKSLPSGLIFSTCEIARPRFTQFLKANPNFIVTTGNKRSTLYSLK